MNWQLVIVVMLVGGAGLYLVRQTWRTWSGKRAGCGGGCDCARPLKSSNDQALVSSEEILGRLRQSR